MPSRGKPAHASDSWPLSWAVPVGYSSWASPARRRATLSRLERALAHSSSETERLSSPYLPEAGKSGGSHDTAESLVARYFDCVALPLGGDAALPRLRMKRPARHEARRPIVRFMVRCRTKIKRGTAHHSTPGRLLSIAMSRCIVGRKCSCLVTNNAQPSLRHQAS